MPNFETSFPPSRHKKQRKSTIQWLQHTRSIVRIIGACAILFFEHGIFRFAIQRCSASMQSTNSAQAAIVLIGDPQLIDENTYSRRGWRLRLTQIITDRYMRKNYALIKRLIPQDLTIFLGDLFDGGREWDDAKWHQEASRFIDVFPDADKNTTICSLPGNHDIGIAENLNSKIYERFHQRFGTTSKLITIANWDIVLLDAIALSSGNQEIKQEHQNFLESLNASKPRPRMLVMHIPPYRAADEPCGPLRESRNVIKIQKGYQYQNVLDFEISEEIWQKIRPNVVFAGDDHDYCDHLHKNGVRVINVKTFSMAMGVNRPGFQHIKLSANAEFETRQCLLPNQLTIFCAYAIILCISVMMITLHHYSTKNQFLSYLPVSTDSTQSKHRSKRHPRTLKKSLLIVFREFLVTFWPLFALYFIMAALT